MRQLTAEEIELGNKEWAKFGQSYPVFGDDASLYEKIDEEDDDDRPAADADVCEAREAGESAGAAHKSGESTSEQSCARVKKKARTSETTAASRVSQPDSLIALLMHKVEEMDQYDAAANAREEAWRKEQMERDEAFFQERMDWYRQEMELHRRMVEAQTQHQAQMHELLMTAFKAAAAGPKAQGSVALPNLGVAYPVPAELALNPEVTGSIGDSNPPAAAIEIALNGPPLPAHSAVPFTPVLPLLQARLAAQGEETSEPEFSSS
ncbi:g11107 [Coccomyxa viridis]|uniref:G11107 protein n=1 Tax=Coccomyxa viridis TaxID=1274662 RepID=A0ABP1GE56_9CHLO